MKKIFLILVILAITLSCKTLNYKFIEEYSGEEKQYFKEQIAAKRLFPATGTLEGIFIEKGNTYKFLCTYDLPKEKINLKFFSALDDDLICCFTTM